MICYRNINEISYECIGYTPMQYTANFTVVKRAILRRNLLPTRYSPYTPNGYLVPAEFDVHFHPYMKNVTKRTKMHLNEVGLTNTEICKSPIQSRQPPISWKMSSFSAFCNTGVIIPVTAILQGC